MILSLYRPPVLLQFINSYSNFTLYVLLGHTQAHSYETFISVVYPKESRGIVSGFTPHSRILKENTTKVNAFLRPSIGPLLW